MFISGVQQDNPKSVASKITKVADRRISQPKEVHSELKNRPSLITLEQMKRRQREDIEQRKMHTTLIDGQVNEHEVRQCEIKAIKRDGTVTENNRETMEDKIARLNYLIEKEKEKSMKCDKQEFSNDTVNQEYLNRDHCEEKQNIKIQNLKTNNIQIKLTDHMTKRYEFIPISDSTAYHENWKHSSSNMERNTKNSIPNNGSDTAQRFTMRNFIPRGYDLTQSKLQTSPQLDELETNGNNTHYKVNPVDQMLNGLNRPPLFKMNHPGSSETEETGNESQSKIPEQYPQYSKSKAAHEVSNSMTHQPKREQTRKASPQIKPKSRDEPLNAPSEMTHASMHGGNHGRKNRWVVYFLFSLTFMLKGVFHSAQRDTLT